MKHSIYEKGRENMNNNQDRTRYCVRDETLKHYGYKTDKHKTAEVYIGRRENNKDFKEILEKLSRIPEFAENERDKITIEYDPTYAHFLVIMTQPSMSNHQED